MDKKYDRLIEIFKEISKIPRNSKEEGKIADYLCEFAKKNNLVYRKDDLNNVLIKKHASQTMEEKPAILLQAHTDMVCVKISESNHDFTTDPIEIIQEGNVLYAKDTTLGADDGIGVALLLLILEDNSLDLPEIECLFTTQEEIGMYGAKYFDYTDISAKYLINLDGEEEDTAIVGCAGGVSLNYDIEYKPKNIVKKIYELSITGLYGGHSGVDINKGRINSNYLAALILKEVKDIELISFIGGNKDNAIPNNTQVCFSSNDKNIKEYINKIINSLKVTSEDSNLKVELNLVDNTKELSGINQENSKDIISLILNLNQSVIEYSKDIKDLVETSGNIGIVKLDNGKCHVVISMRSSDDLKKQEYTKLNNDIAVKYGFNVTEEGDYSGWKYNKNSKLEEIYKEAYQTTHAGKSPVICAIHAGVECGLIYEKLPHLDMISLGPNVYDVHTVNEKLDLNSCRKLLETLVFMLGKLD